MDGVPASLDLLGAVSGFLDEDDSGESVVQIPQVHGGNPALEIPAQEEREREKRERDTQRERERETHRERERDTERVSQAPGQSERGGACTHRSLYWSKALLASTSSLRRRAEGMAPSSIGGSYLLLQGDLRETSNQQTIFPSNYVFSFCLVSGLNFDI